MINIPEILSDLKQALAHYYYALDDEWTGDCDAYDIDEIRGVAEKYGWSKEEVLGSIPPIL